jgi:DNA-binding transcriptional ArsR family regulator
MPPEVPGTPEDPINDVIRLTTDEQLRAVNSLLRHRIIRLLRDGPATISQIADKLGLLKGSSSYHVRLLERAGIVHVVKRRKVRGVTERYYAPTSRRIELPEPAVGAPDFLMRHALADLESAPPDPTRLVRLQHARIGAERFAEFTERLEALMDELGAATEPGETAVSLAVAFYRPQDPGRAGGVGEVDDGVDPADEVGAVDGVNGADGVNTDAEGPNAPAQDEKAEGEK